MYVRALVGGREAHVAGKAVQNPGDAFSPRIGRDIALGRALKNLRRVADEDGISLVYYCASDPEVLYDLWQERTGRTDPFSASKRALCLPFIDQYGFSMVDRAIAGIAYDHHVVGTRHYNDWEFLFRSRHQFEESANRAPRTWKPLSCDVRIDRERTLMKREEK